MTTKKPVPILLRVPPALLKKIEAAARTGERSRNKEACRRLAASFAKKPAATEHREEHDRMVAQPRPTASEKRRRGQA